MRRAGWLVTIGIAASCASATATAEQRPTHGEQSGPAPRCNLAPTHFSDCGAAGLPRMEDKSWAEGEAKRLPKLAAKGTVAVTWDGRQARLLDGCSLDGGYTEVEGESSSDRLWGTNRIVFRPDEIPESCRAATHVVATFVAPRPPPIGAPAAGVPTAILVPLSCPSVSDTTAARGCVGRGLTGPERLERARESIARARELIVPDRTSGNTRAQLSAVLEILALAPDDFEAMHLAMGGSSADCALVEQIHWLGSQYINTLDAKGKGRMKPASQSARPSPPRFFDGWAEGLSCLARPVFLQCFLGQFDPAPANAGCWVSVKGAAPSIGSP